MNTRIPLVALCFTYYFYFPIFPSRHIPATIPGLSVQAYHNDSFDLTGTFSAGRTDWFSSSSIASLGKPVEEGG